MNILISLLFAAELRFVRGTLGWCLCWCILIPRVCKQLFRFFLLLFLMREELFLCLVSWKILNVINGYCVDDITEDRMLALRKRAEVDSKYIITFTLNDASEFKQSLHRHGIFFFISINHEL